MWLFAMFDLPVGTKAERKEYTRFRKALVGEGFTMLQFSVYARFCPSEEAADAYRRRVRLALPEDGQVRIIAVTDKQFGKMEIYLGESREEPEKPPSQLLLF
ncbi:MAG: CRISPR-associated endonuclease Cas2 [Candidatus Methylomirabilis sp.]|nr:CRISPR-associated endonuclease Cas2 [Deltaproteobacteria bacterium]